MKMSKALQATLKEITFLESQHDESVRNSLTEQQRNDNIIFAIAFSQCKEIILKHFGIKNHD